LERKRCEQASGDEERPKKEMRTVREPFLFQRKKTIIGKNRQHLIPKIDATKNITNKKKEMFPSSVVI